MFSVSVNINPLKVFSLIRQNTKRRTLSLYLKWFILRRLRSLPVFREVAEYLQVVESANRLRNERESLLKESLDI